MPTLAHRQQKIQEKRKQTLFREFVKEIASRKPLNIYNHHGMLARYPDTPRKWAIIDDPLITTNNKYSDDYTGDFFIDFQRFYKTSKKPALVASYENENAKYTDSSYGTKNAYLSFNTGLGTENVLYSLYVRGNCDNIINSGEVFYNSSVIFESKNIRQSAFIFYCCNIDNSSDLRFCRDMIGCHNCIDCDSLVNKSYYINNKSYTKEEYEQKKAELLKQKSAFPKVKQAVFEKMGNLNAKNNTGTGIINSENIEDGYMVVDTYNARNVVAVSGGNGFTSQNLYDCCAVSDSTDMYATLDTGRTEQSFGIIRWGDWSSHCYYGINMVACSFCLGCMGLQNKSYCIFNKEYSKEERHTKVDEIFSQMEKDWTLWQFFPATMNPFYFNDTAAYLIDPSFTKEEVEAAGYLRRDEPIKVDIPTDLEPVKVSDLDQYEGYDENGKRHIDEAILKKVIIDEQGNARRVVNMEYVFLMKYGFPLPRKHRLERMKENFKIG